MKIAKGKICTKRQCLLFLKIFVTGMLLFFNLSAYAQETMKFDKEAKKLEFIRQMLSKEKYLRQSEDCAPHCKQMMKDLLASKNFKAIEPEMRADSVDDPRLAKWRQCEDKDLSGVLIFESLYQLGEPPYRFYNIEMDEDKEYGPEDVVYHNQRKDALSGSTGYTRVDLNNCWIKKGGFDVTGALTVRSRKPNAVYLNTLVYYKGKLWAVDFIDGHGFALFHWLDRERMETCHWFIFKSEEEKKEYYKIYPTIKTNRK